MASIGELTGTISLDGTQALASLNKISGLLSTGLGMAGIGLTIAGLMDLGRTAENAGDLAEGLSRNFGSVTGTMSKLRGAVQGAVSDMDLMKGANEMAVKGITNNADQIGMLWQTAQIKGKEMGTSTTEAFNNIEAAIMRPAMLKQLGIELPKGLSATADGMTNAKVRTAAFNAVLADGAKKIEQYNKAGISIADPWEQFDATMTNLKQTLGLAVGPLLVAIANIITQVAKAIAVFIERNKVAIQNVLNFAKSILVVIGTLLGLNQVLGDTSGQTNGIDESFDNLFGTLDTGFKGAVSGADDTVVALKKVQKEIDQENYDFNKSMNDIITGRQKQVSDNKKELAKQTADFDKSQKDAKKAEVQKTADMKRSLDQRIEDLKTNMANTLIVGSKTYDADLARYQEIINKEKEEGLKKIDEQEQLFKDETAIQQKEFEDRTAALKAAIKEDEDFLIKHAADVKLINQGMILDEIDELKKGHEQKLADIRQSNANQLGAMNTFKNQVTGFKIPPVTLDLKMPDFNQAVQNIKDGISSVLTAFKDTIVDFFKPGSEYDKSIKKVQDANPLLKLIPDTKNLFTSPVAPKFLATPEAGTIEFAEGTSYAQGGLSIVGERGPELVNLPRGSQVIPNNEINDYSGKSITVNNFIDKGFDVDAFNNRLNFQLRTL